MLLMASERALESGSGSSVLWRQSGVLIFLRSSREHRDPAPLGLRPSAVSAPAISSGPAVESQRRFSLAGRRGSRRRIGPGQELQLGLLIFREMLRVLVAGHSVDSSLILPGFFSGAASPLAGRPGLRLGRVLACWRASDLASPAHLIQGVCMETTWTGFAPGCAWGQYSSTQDAIHLAFHPLRHNG